ncbi:hybrid sensor histidine kinase/response regulator [Natronosalvus amylolyticus]|uniref:hybrid sensor histidine kinase/response regulator n=1 Tax=Natronosalvus amylolyticus TaxID=2961994 RepID=UPI0020CA2083|nr:hybrid sensor histidine kinase/response regulator [Natronosalvus amylolyticus]
MNVAGPVDLLLVEDDLEDARTVQRLFTRSQGLDRGATGSGRNGDVRVEHADRLADALEALEERSPDAVLLDLMLPDSAGIDTVDAVVERAPTVPIVVLTGQSDVDIGVEAIRRGAQDYLVKGTLTAELLVRTLRYAIERAHTQHELREQNHHLALLHQFVRTDVRTDANMIMGWSDHLEDRVDRADQPVIERLLDTSRHLLDRTDAAADFLDVLETREHDLEPTNLSSMLEGEIERVSHETDADITLKRSSPNPEDEPVFVEATSMLEIAFKHLFENAVIHTDRETPQITVTTTVGDDRVRVAIADDGVGIPDVQKERLTDPMARFDNLSGMGLGLYIVTTLLEEFGADLEIEDNDPRGTIVTTTFDRSNPA